MRNKLISQSFFFALGEGIYIFLVVLVMSNANKLFGNNPSILPMISVLMLFVLSAAVSGALILGKPIWLYLEGKKKEALSFFGFTLGWMFLFFLVLLACITIFHLGVLN
jgi:hypothetical protein